MDKGVDTAGHPSERRGYMWFIALITCMGSLLFGYNTAVVNGSLGFMSAKSQLALSPFNQGVVSSGLTLGAAFGAVLGGPLSDRMGRKRILLWLGAVFSLGALGCAWAPSSGILLVFRFILGLAVGSASANVPLFLAEVAPAHMRGQMVSMNQLMIVFGQFLSFGVNAWLGSAFGNNAAIWRLMLGVATIPGILLWIGMFFVPETPRWLAAQGRYKDAFNSLVRIRSNETADLEMKEIRDAIRKDKEQEEKAASLADFKKPWIMQIVITGATLGVIQQFAGINSVMYYGTQILEASGFGSKAALISNVANGLFSCIGAIIGMYTVDRLGRKFLEYSGLTVCAICLICVGLIRTFANGASWSGVAVMIIVLIYIIFFQGTLGPVTWLINSEIFPARYRGLGTGITIFVLWFANFLVGLFFPVMLSALGLATSFYIFAACCILGLFFVHARIPETKGVQLEEVESYFRAKYDKEYKGTSAIK
ncbi:sugar porter family MFS transporter [Liquorilactobacillus uvarum]|uniref:Major myo-inositol transporter iolt n=1 Tax=Liquorilactobacillus uvarum DSM 19971 TaxID=1423812 RepID=A0A0R1Q100_9LACO|nr:sugar porter family MFS transporter [Liquorilactobacillus uvarum]KRL38367.1 major myo-inositol transporter iolt [Liquorilactobacillus uvarum DSM 19971]